MATTLQQFRDDLRDHCGISTEWDDPTTDRLLNKSFWEVQDLYDFREEEATVDINTIVGTSSYALQADQDSIQNVRILDNNSNEFSPLKYKEDEEFTAYLSNREDSQAKPEFYTRRGGNIILDSTPNDVYTIRVHYKKSLGDILSNGTGIPQAWDEVVLWGAIWRGYARLGDYNRKQQAKATQAELVQPKKSTKVKELEDTRMAGVSVPRRPYR